MLRAVVAALRLSCTTPYTQPPATVATCEQLFSGQALYWKVYTTCAAAASSISRPGNMEQPAAIQELLLYKDPESLKAHVERSWEHFRSLGSPQYHVAPMVDQVGGSACGGAVAAAGSSVGVAAINPSRQLVKAQPGHGHVTNSVDMLTAGTCLRSSN